MSIHQFNQLNVLQSCSSPFRVMLNFINVHGGFYGLYRIIAKDFGNLDRSFLATNTLKI